MSCKIKQFVILVLALPIALGLVACESKCESDAPSSWYNPPLPAGAQDLEDQGTGEGPECFAHTLLTFKSLESREALLEFYRSELTEKGAKPVDNPYRTEQAAEKEDLSLEGATIAEYLWVCGSHTGFWVGVVVEETPSGHSEVIVFRGTECGP
jgi:hypothetical protein